MLLSSCNTNGASEDTLTDWVQASTDASFEGRADHSSVVFDNKIWVIGGTNGDVANDYDFSDVWYSENGVDWTEATSNAAFGEANGASCFVFNDKMWVLGSYDGSDGHENDIHSSSDGVTWDEVNLDPAFSNRGLAVTLEYDGYLWMLGGYPSISNGVYYSLDGDTWTQAVGISEPFSGQVFKHSAVVYDNKMWTLGGMGASYEYHQNIWYSTDGVDWVEAGTGIPFGARQGHTSVVFDGKVWVIGGNNGSEFYNDVWYAE